jgi:hypothetical protein
MYGKKYPISGVYRDVITVTDRRSFGLSRPLSHAGNPLRHEPYYAVYDNIIRQESLNFKAKRLTMKDIHIRIRKYAKKTTQTSM